MFPLYYDDTDFVCIIPVLVVVNPPFPDDSPLYQRLRGICMNDKRLAAWLYHYLLETKVKPVETIFSEKNVR